MYLKEYVSWMVHEYPLMFKSDTLEETELKALDHLFFISDNGMGWYDGYLLEYDANGVKWKKKTTPHSFRVITRGPKYAEIRFGEPLDSAFLKMDTIEEVEVNSMKVKIPQRSKHPWYPGQITERSRIFDIPKNVQIDWLAGAAKYLSYAISFYSDSMRVARDDETFITIMESYHEKDIRQREKLAKTYIEGIEETLRKAVAVLLPQLKRAKIVQGQEDDIINSVVP